MINIPPESFAFFSAARISNKVVGNYAFLFALSGNLRLNNALYGFNFMQFAHCAFPFPRIFLFRCGKNSLRR